MNREIARECLTNGGRKTSEEEIDRFMKAFQEGSPVLPMPFFCDALTTWSNLFMKPPEIPLGHEETDRYDIKTRKEFGQDVQRIFIKIRKSNLLWRMLYEGEKPRTKPCPVHKGRWSGCRLPEEMECKGACADGLNVTGWLKEE